MLKRKNVGKTKIIVYLYKENFRMYYMHFQYNKKTHYVGQRTNITILNNLRSFTYFENYFL